MFGLDVLDASLLPSVLVALLAGMISFLSPCVLPIVPPYLAYMSGISVSEMGERQHAGPNRAVVPALFFVLGLSTVFLLMGFTASMLGRFFLGHREWFMTGAGIVIMIFGAHFIGVFRLGFLDRDARFDAGDRGGSALGAYVLGLAFAFGWTPCIGPVLGSILTLAADQASLTRGTALLGAYALGLGVPFLLVAAFFPRLKGPMGYFRRHMQQIERLMGLLLWTVGLLMLTGAFADLSWWLLETVPGLATLG